MIAMMVFMVLFWALVIVGVVWLVRGVSVDGWNRTRQETPSEILERRFAEGAISVEDYRQRKDVLASGGTAP